MLAISDIQINAWVGVFAWPFARIVGLFLTEPIFAYRGVPRSFKVGFALILTVILSPLLPPLPAVPLASAEGIAILVQQLLIGLSMGFVMRIVISAVELTGFIIGAQTGLGFAMFYDPVHAAQVPVLSQMLSLLTFFLFLAFDGHHVVLSALVHSFQVLPIGMAMPAQGIKALVLWGGIWSSGGVAGDAHHRRAADHQPGHRRDDAGGSPVQHLLFRLSADHHDRLLHAVHDAADDDPGDRAHVPDRL
ncbi:flagellar biosynthesis protein FliR [Chromobacterium vaccinii]|nr:flagellar biosynthesis protein FliR [Chromobacterium vaccinii]